jgi:hypothetical protein
MSRLSTYNEALRILGERRLVSLSENTPGRLELDAVWDNAFKFVLEGGYWNFATRTVLAAADIDVEPIYGFDYAFLKPDDWVRTTQISVHADFSDPLNEYEDERGYWHANVDTIYVRYVSSDEDYGGDEDAWPISFVKALAAYLAFEVCLVINNNKSDRNDLFQLYEKRLREAKSRDAMNEPTRPLPAGNWTRARRFERSARTNRSWRS